MWSGTSGYTLDQSNYRIHESPVSPEKGEGWKWNAQTISKEHTRYFQNEEFALYISKIKEGMK